MRFLSAFLLSAVIATPALADTYVRGYTKSNGTYVAPHYRSSPDNSRSNNYGTAGAGQSSSTYSRQYRDSDRDGISNRYDMDDNNNGVYDNRE